MKHLKEVINEAVEDAGIKSAINQETAIILWEEAVGEVVSSVTKAERVESGTLTIKVETAVWRQELHMQKKEIINKLNKKIGTRAIRDIRFIWAFKGDIRVVVVLLVVGGSYIGF